VLQKYEEEHQEQSFTVLLLGLDDRSEQLCWLLGISVLEQCNPRAF
jgi:hypothetical protein